MSATHLSICPNIPVLIEPVTPERAVAGIRRVIPFAVDAGESMRARLPRRSRGDGWVRVGVASATPCERSVLVPSVGPTADRTRLASSPTVLNVVAPPEALRATGDTTVGRSCLNRTGVPTDHY